MNANQKEALDAAIHLLNLHHDSFFAAAKYARETLHPVPCDTRGWSQILVSLLTGISGRGRQKGSDLVDGSDVKAANTWEAIDTPRFNGCIKAGTQSSTAGCIESLDSAPYLFFVLWDKAASTKRPRCRIWCVHTKTDPLFRKMSQEWYARRANGDIRSNNFQLHPPRGKDSDEFKNTCGNLLYPLLLRAEHNGERYDVITYNPEVLEKAQCRPTTNH